MTLLLQLITSLASGAAGQAGGKLFVWAVAWFRKYRAALKQADVGRLLSELGTTTARQIRELIETGIPAARKLPVAQREELITFLPRLHHATVVTSTTRGAPQASVPRHLRLIE